MRYFIFRQTIFTACVACIVSATFLRADEPSTTSTAPTLTSSGYQVLNKVKIGGEGRWDYLTLDAEVARLYVPRASHLMVLDSNTLKVVGDIPDTDGIHGVALVPELHRGFTSNGKANTVTVFDTQTLAVLCTLHAGKKPDAIIYDPATKKVLVCNGKSEDVSIFNPDFDQAHPPEATTLALGGTTEFAVADGAGKVYVNLEDKSEIVEFDPVAAKVLNHWPLTPGDSPTGLSMDRATRRLFAGCANELMVIINADTGKVVTTLPIGKHVDATAFDADRHLAFASNGDGTLSVIKENNSDHFESLAPVPTQVGARTMALDPKSHHIFLATAEFQPPEPGKANARPTPIPDSFTILMVGPDK